MQARRHFGRIVQLAEHPAVTNPTGIVLGSSPSPPSKFQTDMKQHSEKRTEAAVKLLIQTLTRNFYDTGIVLDEFEATHNDWECDQSKQYAALVAGHFALKDALEKINNRLNK